MTLISVLLTPLSTDGLQNSRTCLCRMRLLQTDIAMFTVSLITSCNYRHLHFWYFSYPELLNRSYWYNSWSEHCQFYQVLQQLLGCNEINLCVNPSGLSHWKSFSTIAKRTQNSFSYWFTDISMELDSFQNYLIWLLPIYF